jgi:hypothetical protein
VASAEELARVLLEEWAPPAVTRARTVAARALLDRHRGAAQRSAELVARVLRERAG